MCRYNELLQRRSESPREITNGVNNTSPDSGGRESPFQVIKDEHEVQVQNVQQVQLGKPAPSSTNSNNRVVLSPSVIEEKEKQLEAVKTQENKLRSDVAHKDAQLEELKKRVENREGLVQQKDAVIAEKVSADLPNALVTWEMSNIQ